MSKFFKLLLIIFFLKSCSYQPIHLNKNFNFQFSDISFEGEKKINELIKRTLLSSTSGEIKYDLFFKSKKIKEIIKSDTKGDPKIFRIIVNVNYKVLKNGEQILQNKSVKQSTYNSINDKYELTQYENNILRSLSDNISSEILFSIKVLN